jgi:hypothetical protein
MTFDQQGNVVTLQGETAGTDRKRLTTTVLDDDDAVILSVDGSERRRFSAARSQVTVEEIRAGLSQGALDSYAAATGWPDARTYDLDGREVILLEDRRPFTGTAPNAEAPGFQLPYVTDLDPVEVVRRRYVDAAEYWEVKSEILVVGADGTETVVESHGYDVFEVIAQGEP